jgi:hypothetical protein
MVTRATGKFFYAFMRDYQRQAAAGTLQPNALDR